MIHKSKSAAQKYNDNLHKSFAPEIARLQKVEVIAKEILTAIETQKTNYPSSDNCHLVNIVQRILSEKTNLKTLN